MNFDKLNKTVKLASDILDKNEKIVLSVLSVRLNKIAQQNPDDATIVNMANVISRMEDNKLFITKGEFKNLYKKLYSRNTKIAEYFVEELGGDSYLATPKVMNRDGENYNSDIVAESVTRLTDPFLAAGLDVIFGGNIKRAYTNDMANRAVRACKNTLVDIGLQPKTISASAGHSGIIVCTASYETPKGDIHVLFPVEINTDGKPSLPSVFVGNNGPEDINRKTLVAYITSNAGKSLKVTAQKVVELVNLANKQEVSAVDTALTKLNATKETLGEFSAPTIMYQKIDDVEKQVELPKYTDLEFNNFAQQFNSNAGVASFQFGEKKITLARNLINRNLQNFGFDHSQIKVVDSNKDTIFYGVSLNGGKVAFKVPVKIEKDKILTPDVIISNGSINSFSREGISKLFEEESSDYKIVAMASPLYDLKPSELIEKVKEAVIEENYAKAEDALNILSQSKDEKAYVTAFNIFTNGLTKKTASAKEECKCKLILKNANSKHPICGHTNLPIHKVYQDKNGDCQPLYRKAMDESYDGAYFMGSKVLLG